MAPTAGSALQRWTDKEDEILVEMTNDQLEIEEEDKSKVVSWTQHWNQVSARLREEGYKRSSTACRAYWKRSIAFQLSNEDAAGPRWSDSEHYILVHMAEDQLELERRDNSLFMTWGELWKKVSSALQLNGFARTPDQCEAFWMLVQNGSADAVRTGSEAEDQSRVPGGETDNEGEYEDEDEDEDFLVAALEDASIRQPGKPNPWTDEEYENLFQLLKDRRELEGRVGIDKLTGKRFWTIISQMHLETGFDRSWETCYGYWHNHGRSRSGFDERQAYYPGTSTGNRLTGLQPSSPFSIWSPGNEVGGDTIATEDLPRKDPTLPEFEKDMLSSGERPVQSRIFQSAPGPPPSAPINMLFSDSETSDNDIVRAQGVQKKSTYSQSSTESPSSNSKPSYQSVGLIFRFTAEQKQALVTEAHDNGAFPNRNRRKELARLLGVEEVSIKDWFIHFRQVNQDDVDYYERTPRVQRVSTTSSDSHQSSYSFQSALPSTRSKRRHTSLNTPAVGSYSHKDLMQPAKKPRIRDRNVDSEQTIIISTANDNDHGDHSSAHRNSARETSLLDSPEASPNSRQPNQAWTVVNDTWSRSSCDKTPQASRLSETSTAASSEAHNDGVTQTSITRDDASTMPKEGELLQSSWQAGDPQEHSGIIPELRRSYPNILAQDLFETSSKTGREGTTSEVQPKTKSGGQTKGLNGSAVNNPNGLHNSSPQPNREGAGTSGNILAETSPPANKSQQAIVPLAIMSLDISAQQSKGNPTSPASPLTINNVSSTFATSSQEQRSKEAAPQPVTFPTIAALEEDFYKTCASEAVKKLRANIRDLNQGKTKCGAILSTIEEKIGKIEADDSALGEWKESEIARAIKEIEEKYQGTRSALLVRQESLNEEKRQEEEMRDRYEREISKKNKFLDLYQAIVDESE